MADDAKHEKIWLDRVSVQRARNAIITLRRRGISWMTLVSVMQTGISQLEQEFNGGRPFPECDGPLRAGRPPKVSPRDEARRLFDDTPESGHTAK